jgi:hypothetical protein
VLSDGVVDQPINNTEVMAPSNTLNNARLIFFTEIEAKLVACEQYYVAANYLDFN